MVWMERATRVLWDLHWGRQDRKMLKKALGLLGQVIAPPGERTRRTDGERRDGRRWFARCRPARRTGKRGRPKKTWPQGVKVRRTHKGAQRPKRAPQRPTDQAPYPEPPDTAQSLAPTEMPAHHLEACHPSLRRRWAA